MFRRAAIAVSGAVLLVGSSLSLATAEASVPHDRAPAPLLKLGKFRHDFSPNKDGYHDQLKIPVTLARRGYLTVRVVNLDTKIVLAHPYKLVCPDRDCTMARGTRIIRWSDLVRAFDDRNPYPTDTRGRYRLTFYGSTPNGEHKDVAKTVVRMRDAIQLDKDDAAKRVSPNADGRQDRLPIGYDLEQAGRVRAVVRSISPQTGASTVVDRFSIGRKKAGHHSWTWSPGAHGAARATDGHYTVTFAATPLAHRPGAGHASVDVTVDTVGPDATSKNNRTTVYPTTTLFADEIRFQFGEDVQPGTLDASVRRADGTLVSTLKPQTVTCVPGDTYHDFGGDCALVRWDGRDAAGSVPPAGSYTLRVLAYDAAGNRTVATTPLTVSDQPLVEHTKTTTLPAAKWGIGTTSCSYPGPQICIYHEPVASERFADGLSFRAGRGTAQAIYGVDGETGHERFRVTATGGPTTPGDNDTASLSGTEMQGDGTFTTGWFPVELAPETLAARGTWMMSTSLSNDYDVASFTVEQTYFAPAS